MKTKAKQTTPMAASLHALTVIAWIIAGLSIPCRAQAPISPLELVAPEVDVSGGNVNLTVRPSVAGRFYQLQCTESLATGDWQNLGNIAAGNGNNLVITTPHVGALPRRFYRLALESVLPTLEDFALIPAGNFTMGDQSDPAVGTSDEKPVHTVNVSAFYMAKHETTKELWDRVRAWGLTHLYTDLPVGSGLYPSRGVNYPVHTITWYDAVKWCNARSVMEGLTACYTVSGFTYRTGVNTAVVCNFAANGYRLPTEAEWEKAARGGQTGKNFPWGDTITHSQANYRSNPADAYDVSPTRIWHPTYSVGIGAAYTAPVNSFAPNGYGLYNVVGNVSEWCWDLYGESYYSDAAAGNNPRGPAAPDPAKFVSTYRIVRGGEYLYGNMLLSDRSPPPPTLLDSARFGFRLARSSAP